jgi:hypothetical protein
MTVRIEVTSAWADRLATCALTLYGQGALPDARLFVMSEDLRGLADAMHRQAMTACPTCEGTGRGKRSSCPTCRGRREVLHSFAELLKQPPETPGEL